MKKTKYIIVLYLLLFTYMLPAQTVYQHVSNKNIYGYIDELANLKIIDINSVVKPYSRIFIADKLEVALSKSDQLNKRQLKELKFYMEEYKLEIDSLPDYKKLNFFKKKKNFATSINPLGFFYKDKLFTFSVKPIAGIHYYFNENTQDNDSYAYHRWWGAEAFAYVGKHWGFYASLRDNSETQVISRSEYFTLKQGGAFKKTDYGVDYSDMRGGVTYSWKWGSFGLVKDHFEWGNAYHGSMILSDRGPSITQIKLNVKPAKWFELNYIHGWLVSMEVDSVRSDFTTNPPREVYRQKYIAANMLTFTPWKRLNISLGNSIVYSDMGVHPAYLIPIMFYKSVDHTVNQGTDNQNSQMFFDISSRQIKHLHLYGTFFIDELKFDRVSSDSTFNFWSCKVGAKASNLFKKNISINIEYSMSMPITYQHRVSTLTYESNYYNMGYYLRDNSQEIFVGLEYKPIRGLHLSSYFLLAQHGPDYEYITGSTAVTHKFMEDVKWQNQSFSIKATYEFISNAYVFLEYLYNNYEGDVDITFDSSGQPVETDYLQKYTPEIFYGITNTISAGFNIGF